MAGWTCRALEEAFGSTYASMPDAPAPMRGLRWRCGHAVIDAIKGASEEFYELRVGCKHRHHHELAQYPLLRVYDVALLDATGATVTVLPCDPSGYLLRFSTAGPLLQSPPVVRVESWPDSEGPHFTQIEEGRAGVYTGAPEPFEVPLSGNAHHDRQLSVHVVDAKTARRDWGADGVCLWRIRVPVQ